MQDVDIRTAAGAAVLDSIMPGWHDLIDLEDLDMNSACGCVLGQIVSDINSCDFWSWLDPEAPDLTSTEKMMAHDSDEVPVTFTHAQAVAYGFQAVSIDDATRDDDLDERDYKPLANAWKRLIRARRIAAQRS